MGPSRGTPSTFASIVSESGTAVASSSAPRVRREYYESAVPVNESQLPDVWLQGAAEPSGRRALRPHVRAPDRKLKGRRRSSPPESRMSSRVSGCRGNAGVPLCADGRPAVGRRVPLRVLRRHGVVRVGAYRRRNDPPAAGRTVRFPATVGGRWGRGLGDLAGRRAHPARGGAPRSAP